jgi:hypothetical protein
MVRAFREARRLGWSRGESLRFAWLLARLARHDPLTDTWGRPVAGPQLPQRR